MHACIHLNILKVQQIFLWFCVASIVLPGSLFDPSGYLDEFTFQSWWDNFKSAFEVDSPLSGGGGGGFVESLFGKYCNVV